jgi:thiaminase/transcriptional activator TenA
MILSSPRLYWSVYFLQYRQLQFAPTVASFSSNAVITTMSINTDTTSNSVKKNDIRYNFWRGHPNNDLLPVTEMQQILSTMASTNHKGPLQTSLQYLASDRGDPALLSSLERFLRNHTRDDELPTLPAITTTQTLSSTSSSNPPLDMFLTHGVSHGLDILCTTQTTPGDTVLVERPTYFLADDIFRSHGLQVHSLPMKQHKTNGTFVVAVDVDALQEGLENGSIAIPRMIYIIPTHQNPTGHTMCLEDRWKLCHLARTFGILVAADEVYHLLDWRDMDDDDATNRRQRRRPARFAVLDHLVASTSVCESMKKCETKEDNNEASDGDTKRSLLGCAVSVNSFTKIFTPGIRCGWIEGPTEIIESLVDLGYIQSQGGCAPFVGEMVRTALEGGWQERILKQLVTSYKARCKKLCEILESEPGIHIRNRPLGGFFLWVDFKNLPEPSAAEDTPSVGGDAAAAFAKYCFDRGLKIMPGSRADSVLEDCASSRQPKDLCFNSARLCFADMDVQDLEEGATLLIQYYRQYVESAVPMHGKNSLDGQVEIGTGEILTRRSHQQGMPRFTDQLRSSASEQWERITNHRFTKELAAGTIDRQAVLKRYLIQDHRFLDSFTVLLASIIAQLPTLEDRIPGAQFLAVITGPENTYFERSFEALGVSATERREIPDAVVTTKFCKLMREVAMHGSLGEMLAVIIVCEWSYLSWGQLVKEKTVRDDFVTYEWVDLHSGEEFERVVEYLRSNLDREGERMDATEREACLRRFLEAVQLEEEFFDYAYSE